MVNPERINKLLAHPSSLEVDDLSMLQELMEQHPYFQATRSIYLKGLFLENSPMYNKELQRTAAHTTDRSVLFDFITSADFTQIDIGEIIKQNQEKGNDKAVDRSDASNTSSPKTIEEDLNASKDFSKVTDQDLFEKKSLNIKEQPLKFDTGETHSFSQWLQLTSLKPIQRSGDNQPTSTDKGFPTVDIPKAIKKVDDRARKMARIDQFLSEKPKIKPRKSSGGTFNLADQSNEQHTLMTETLARVYLAQNNYAKAIKAYEILILQHPEKSGLFADQIQEIKNLQSNNS
ncbi:tetratricopeptide repeat protein [Nonlabens xiamenensis]|uniref:tetratricopeptide repeat protein n=1 Tax=Nonlabens xiamenensis TaxID=2341043 RepID=UPI000F613DF8|nr:tetratricopeptide repeat protein [Nonlabens xiamenensis]